MTDGNLALGGFSVAFNCFLAGSNKEPGVTESLGYHGHINFHTPSRSFLLFSSVLFLALNSLLPVRDLKLAVKERSISLICPLLITQVS